jgi:hypothetical protein
MSDSDLRADVNALMEHNGLREKIAAKVAANRVAICAEARGKKRDAEKRFIAERIRLQVLLDAADQKQVDAQKAAEAAMQDWIKIRQQFSDIHDSLTATNAAHDAVLKKHADPAIAEFVAELRALRDECRNLYRTSEDENGKAIDNRVAVDRRVRALSESIEAAQRLTTAHDVSSVADEIERIRNAIPKT